MYIYINMYVYTNVCIYLHVCLTRVLSCNSYTPLKKGHFAHLVINQVVSVARRTFNCPAQNSAKNNISDRAQPHLLVLVLRMVSVRTLVQLYLLE